MIPLAVQSAELQDAARDGDLRRLAALLGSADPNQTDSRGFTPLIMASYHGQAGAVALLLGAGAAVDVVDAKGSTALSGAAFKGHCGIARLLLDAGAAVDAPDEAGRTPLLYAVMFGRTEMAALLVAHGADPQRRDEEGVSAADVARQGDSALLAALGCPA